MPSNTGHSLKKDMGKVRRFASKIEERLRESDDRRLGRLTDEQLQDLDELVRIADYILAKYEDNRDMHGILKELVLTIRTAADSIDQVDSEIEELVLSAEDSISRIREAQAKMARGADVGRRQ